MAGWISISITPKTDIFFYGNYGKVTDSTSEVPIVTISRNAQTRSAFLSITLLAWFQSYLILFLGNQNVINFPSLKDCPWLIMVKLSALSIFRS